MIESIITALIGIIPTIVVAVFSIVSNNLKNCLTFYRSEI